MKTTKTQAINTAIIAESFGVVDCKGRVIGAHAWTFELDFVEISQDAPSYYTMEPGHYFVFCPQAIRDRVSFGAIQRDRYFKTEAERDAAVNKYLIDARKRAVKLAAKVVA
jgi:hypothetical protein